MRNLRRFTEVQRLSGRNCIELWKVNSPIDPGNERLEEAASQLDAGLRSCRAVLSNYRSLLAGDAGEVERQAGFSETDDGRDDSVN